MTQNELREKRRKGISKKTCKRCKINFETLANGQTYCELCGLVKDRERAQNPIAKARNAELARKYRLENPEKFRRLDKIKRMRDKERTKRNNLVCQAIKNGQLGKPDYCLFCGKLCKPEGHHPDYTKPLVITWLCKECHNKIHRLGLYRQPNQLELQPLDEENIKNIMIICQPLFNKFDWLKYRSDVAHAICKQFGVPKAQLFNKEKYESIVTDLLEKTFPKGECKERGKALLFIAQLWIELEKFGVPKISKERLVEILDKIDLPHISHERLATAILNELEKGGST